MKEILEVNAIERWAIEATTPSWQEYKKKLESKYVEKYPTYEISIKQSSGAGASGKGIIDYIVYGIKK